MTDTSQERADLRASLDKHRFFLRHTLRGLTDEQAALRTTPSALTLGGLIKHVSATEASWATFIRQGPAAFVIPDADDAPEIDWLANFRMDGPDTVQSLLAAYEKVAAETDALVETVDLDAGQPLPQAPWFEPGAVWSARRVLLHIIAETAQHAGHADIIREALDGAKSMS